MCRPMLEDGLHIAVQVTTAWVTDATMADSGKTVDAAGRVFCDIILLVLFSLLDYFMEHGGYTPFERGFFCDDQSIKYPYNRTVTLEWNLLVALGICVTLTIIVLTELPHYISGRRAGAVSGYSLCGISVGLYLVQLYKAVVPIAVAVPVTIAILDVIKNPVGRLRPYFLALCQPDMSAETCMEDGYYKYVTNYTCVGLAGLDPTSFAVRDIRLSFPSGHAAFSFLCAVYLVMYLHGRMTWRWSSLPRHILQVAALCLACYVSATRVSDYEHHTTDVLGGAALGTLIAIIVACFCSDLFHRPRVTVAETDVPLTEYDKLQ